MGYFALLSVSVQAGYFLLPIEGTLSYISLSLSFSLSLRKCHPFALLSLTDLQTLSCFFKDTIIHILSLSFSLSLLSLTFICPLSFRLQQSKLDCFLRPFMYTLSHSSLSFSHSFVLLSLSDCYRI